MSQNESTVRFTYDWYERFLDRLTEMGVQFVEFGEDIGQSEIVLRHDIDYSPSKALTIGEIEAQYDVQSTFYVHLTGVYYNPLGEDVREVLDELVELGHNVAVHFSIHQYWETEPDADALQSQIEVEHDILDTIVDESGSSIAFHNPPDWTINRTFAGFVSTYEPRYIWDITYVADSNQRWRDEGENPLEQTLTEGAQIVTHPVLWGENDGSTVDRIREERDRKMARVEQYTREMNQKWTGSYGI